MAPPLWLALGSATWHGAQLAHGHGTGATGPPSCRGGAAVSRTGTLFSQDSVPQATEDQIKLLRLQRHLQEDFDKPYLDLSLHDTVSTLILDGHHKKAEQLYRDFKIPDKRWVREGSSGCRGSRLLGEPSRAWGIPVPWGGMGAAARWQLEEPPPPAPPATGG